MSSRLRSVGLVVALACIAIASAACRPGRAEPEPIATSLVVRNRGFFDVNVYSMASQSATPTRLGTVVGMSTATFPLRTRDLRPGGMLTVRLHSIGTTLWWTSPEVGVGSGLLAILDVNSDAFGDCSTSSLHTILIADTLQFMFR
jgi:hypothetical protein